MSSFYKIDLQDDAWLDQVFVARNKTYGAYQLRKAYSKRVLVAAGIALGGLLFFLVLPVLINVIGGIIPKEKVIADVNILKPPPPVDPAKPPPPPPKTPPPPPVKTTIKFTPPVIKKDEEVKKEDIPPPVEETKKVDIGAKTVKGDDNAKVEIPEDPNKGSEVGEDPNKIFVSVEQGASYPGGEEAMAAEVSRYLSSHYPAAAKENNIQGKVFVKFVVEKNGTISNLEVLRGKELGGGLAEAAVEAMKKLKKSWIPGRQNGNAVRQYFNFPISFTLQGGDE